MHLLLKLDKYLEITISSLLCVSVVYLLAKYTVVNTKNKCLETDCALLRRNWYFRLRCTVRSNNRQKQR